MSVNKTKHVSYDDLKTLDDLLTCGRKIEYITEYNGFYYMRLESTGIYDETIFKVDRKTRRATIIHYIDYMLEAEDKATEIDPEELKKTLL